MLPLLIRLKHRETGAEQEAGFRRSPVRIGRSHLNDLTLEEGYVSQWHGIVRFDDGETRYLDVGSSNGTSLEGEKLESKEEIVLEPGSTLQIGPLDLTLTREELRDDQVRSRRESSFRLGAGPAADGKAETLMLNEAMSAALKPSRAHLTGGGAGSQPPAMVGAPAMAPAPSTPPAAAAEPARAHASPEAVSDAGERLRPLHEAYAKARGELEKALSETLATLRDQPEAVRALQREVPMGFEIPGMRGRAGLPPVSEEVDVASWLERLVPAGTSAQQGENASAMERAGALLEAFAMGLVELRAAQREVMSRLGVEPSAEGSSLQRIEDPRELLAYLLDARTPAADQVEEVTRAFADVALHQVGMLNGAIEGARAILWEISPHQLGAATGGELARTSPGFGDWLWPFRAVGHYYRFAAKHQELGVGERFTHLLFGSAFVRAYDRVTGAQSGRRSRPSGRPPPA